MDDRIISLTVNVVSAYIAANDVAAVQLPGLIRVIHQALSTVGQSPVEPPAPEPVIAAEKSVFADHLVCLDCGGSHAEAAHLDRSSDDPGRLSGEMGGLPSSYPMVAAEYAAARSAFAKATGLGRKVDAPPPPKKKAGRPKRK